MSKNQYDQYVDYTYVKGKKTQLWFIKQKQKHCGFFQMS